MELKNDPFSWKQVCFYSNCDSHEFHLVYINNPFFAFNWLHMCTTLVFEWRWCMFGSSKELMVVFINLLCISYFSNVWILSFILWLVFAQCCNYITWNCNKIKIANKLKGYLLIIVLFHDCRPHQMLPTSPAMLLSVAEYPMTNLPWQWTGYVDLGFSLLSVPHRWDIGLNSQRWWGCMFQWQTSPDLIGIWIKMLNQVAIVASYSCFEEQKGQVGILVPVGKA